MTIQAFRESVNFSSPYTKDSLPDYWAGTELYLCVCAIFTPSFGNPVAVTTNSRDMTGLPGYSGITFKSIDAGMTASKIEQSAGAQPGNMEADLILTNAGISEVEALSGKWTRAGARVFVVNYEALAMGQVIMQEGSLSQFVHKGPLITCEIIGINGCRTISIGRTVRAECDADLGDDRCKIDMAAKGYIKTGTITQVTDNTKFRDNVRTEAADYFSNGKFKFTSGANAGFQFEVDTWDATNKEWVMRKPFPYVPAIGDTYEARKGCLKTLAACTAEDNVINRRAFDFVDTIEGFIRNPTPA